MISVRIDRLLTLLFFYPLKNIFYKQQGVSIPILMYHSISSDIEDNVHPYYRVNTSPKIFEKHMEFLYANNYSVIPLEMVPKLINKSFDEPSNQVKKYIVVTFDDGFKDFYTQAFPILNKYGFTATVFLATGFMGGRSQKFKNKEFMKWHEVRSLSEEGISFGSHTVTHPQLKSLDRERVKIEIRTSKEDIEEQIGKPIKMFSYPYKFPEEDKGFMKFLRDTLVENQYEVGVSTRLGTTSSNDLQFFMKRIPVNSNDDFYFFKAKLDGGYDWLRWPQFILKKVRYAIGRSG